MSGTGRVVLLAHRLARPEATGIGRYVRGLVTALAADDPGFAVAAAPEHEEATWVPRDVAVLRLPGPRRALHAAWALTARPSLDRLVGRPRLVHVLSPFAPVRTAAPLVATIHDLMPLREPGWYGGGERLGFVRAVERFVATGAHLVAVSEVVAAELASLGADRSRIYVVPNGVDEVFFAPGDPAPVCARLGLAPGRYLVAVGAVSHRKNAVVVVRALARLAPPARPPLVLAGPSADATAGILAEAARLGVDVRHTGWLPDADLAPLVAGAAALVHPSRDEGFGLTPVEAMAAGTPAVVARAGALAETVGDAALLVDPDDPDAWAGAIATVLADADLRARLVAAGRARAAGLTWRRTAAATRRVHELVLGR